jgi:hypothetical protein
MLSLCCTREIKKPQKIELETIKAAATSSNRRLSLVRKAPYSTLE